MKTYALRALRQIETSAKESIWKAHWGCGVIAGALLVEDDLVRDEARTAVIALLERTVNSREDLRVGGPHEENRISRELFAEKLLTELALHADEPKEIGHNVIFSAYVLRALERFEIEPWESLLDGVTTLVRKIKASGPGWITVNGKNEVRVLNEAEARTDEDYWTLFSNFERSSSAEKHDMQLGHLLTHGHAIEMMKTRANCELMADFDLAYRKRLRGLRQAHAEEKHSTALPHQKLDPRTAAYWARVESIGAAPDHALKYAYSFLDLKRGQVSEADMEAFGRIFEVNA